MLKRILSRFRMSPRDRRACDVIDAVGAIMQASDGGSDFDKLKDLCELRDYMTASMENLDPNKECKAIWRGASYGPK